jgi:hypothetical protein
MSPLKPVVVKTRRITIVLVAAAALALPVGAYRLGNRLDDNAALLADNCTRIHQLVRTLDTIIASSTAQVRAYEREGTITLTQRDRALKNQAKQREVLATADCPPPARRAP